MRTKKNEFDSLKGKAASFETNSFDFQARKNFFVEVTFSIKNISKSAVGSKRLKIT